MPKYSNAQNDTIQNTKQIKLAGEDIRTLYRYVAEVCAHNNLDEPDKQNSKSSSHFDIFLNFRGCS